MSEVIVEEQYREGRSKAVLMISECQAIKDFIRGDPMGSKSATWRIQMWGKVLLGSKWISIICNVIILSDFLMCCYAQTNPKNIISSQ